MPAIANRERNLRSVTALFGMVAVMPRSWEGNRRSGVAPAMSHRLQWFIHLRAQLYLRSLGNLKFKKQQQSFVVSLLFAIIHIISTTRSHVQDASEASRALVAYCSQSLHALRYC